MLGHVHRIIYSSCGRLHKLYAIELSLDWQTIVLVNSPKRSTPESSVLALRVLHFQIIGYKVSVRVEAYRRYIGVLVYSIVPIDNTSRPNTQSSIKL